MKKQLKCYIYTRVSTSMQVDGYSLDAQKDKLHKYADYQDMIIAGEYSDEGKSGKSVEGRPQFQQMLQDIETGKDNIDFVLVFKLSRFGRNAADVLSSLQRMQDFGVNLICVEDGIDSSKDAGKLMISVLSAVPEIERENILVQTMEGRRQKAREGKWNGGFAPYGYQLINGELYIAEDEAEVIRIIYDKKYEDMQVRLDKFYDEIEEIVTSIEAVETRLYNIKQEKISGDNVYQFLLFFDKLYDRFTDMEKKTFMKNFLEEVNIYETEQEDGRVLRSLKFRFPVFFNNQELYELDWDNESTLETLVSDVKMDLVEKNS